ncbi:MAG: DUF6786 family protein [Bacteroidales bacterium]
MINGFKKGSYGYDKYFLEKAGIETIELTDSSTGGKILIAPSLQGRVMTSSCAGEGGASYGWINHKFIEERKTNPQFNPFGGEERLWLGPEGGPFSIYFKQNDDQVFANWKVPVALDTEDFTLVNESGSSAEFSRSFSLVNASGTALNIKVDRLLKILGKTEVENALGLILGDSLRFVAYESLNTLQNTGNKPWDKTSGALSIWMLSMFNPSENGIIIIPYKQGDEVTLGKTVTDDYFGKVPAERLIVDTNAIFFKADGKLRSKIGISAERSRSLAAGYDPYTKTLTVLWYKAPENHSGYVNSVWGKQLDPFMGDAINSYNDGPVDDGSIMGPFYEIESSSPAAFLAPDEKISHIQKIFHLTGSEQDLDEVTVKLFGLTLKKITSVFKN